MNIQSVLKSNSTCRALTGLDVNAFRRLLENFTWVYDQHVREQHKLNCKVRAFGGGKKGRFVTYEDKLFLILFFLKVYPTEAVMGVFFDICESATGMRVRYLRPILEKTLGHLSVLPKRKIRSMEELFEKFPEIKEVYVDCMERPVQRKKNKKESNQNYSGKKKTTTRKNLIVSGKGITKDPREILFLSKTRKGKRHDKKISDKDQLHRYINDDIEIYQDTGFQGTQKLHPNVQMPKKKTKKKPLTAEEKENNKLISSIRIIAEHSNWGLKRLNAITHIFRHKISQLDDTCMLLAAGVWNFHLLHKN
jgi:hypothetical protein